MPLWIDCFFFSFYSIWLIFPSSYSGCQMWWWSISILECKLGGIGGSVCFVHCFLQRAWDNFEHVMGCSIKNELGYTFKNLKCLSLCWSHPHNYYYISKLLQLRKLSVSILLKEKSLISTIFSLAFYSHASCDFISRSERGIIASLKLFIYVSWNRQLISNDSNLGGR